jgi:transcriptional regulator GlxA family with amidase domain
MRTKARRVVVVVFDEVELLDVAAPLEVLSTAGRRWNFRPYKVEIAAPRAGLVATRNQVRLEATLALGAVAPAEIVLVPGGYGARRFADDVSAIAELTRIATGAEIIAGIAGGVIALSRAGLVAGARVAASKEMSAALEAELPSAQLDFLTPVLDSGTLVTAANSGAALRLGLTLIARTMGPKLVAMVSTDLGLDEDGHTPRLEVRY